MGDSRRVATLARPLTAAAAAYTPQAWRDSQIFGNQPWQAEAWGFRRTLGEFSQAVDWQARAMSRVRLGAAEVVPGADEPRMLTEGPAAYLMSEFCGGPPGHAAFLRAITPQLLVPGEGWLIAEKNDPRLPLSATEWGVYSKDCVESLGNRFRVRIGPSMWRELEPDALPIRIYEPDPQFPWLATSNAEAAIPIMRRIFLIDSRLVAMMVSRLAMNGIMLIPQEGTITVPKQYGEAPDNFVKMLMDIASKNIANPGNASAGVPIPIKFAGELIEKWRILKPDDPLDEWLLKEREDELGRLGDTLGLSRERVSGGMGEQNHWGAQIASEEETKTLFAPMAETIVGAVTKAYLRPMLVQSGIGLEGPNGGRIIAWYDLSELAARPDKSVPVRQAYIDGVVGPTCYRREIGVDESDAPTEAELAQMMWWKAAGTEQTAIAVQEVTGETPAAGAASLTPSASPSPGVPSVGLPAAGPVTGAPENRAAPRPSLPAPAPMPATTAAGRLNGHRVRAGR